MRFMVMHKVDAHMEAGGQPSQSIIQAMGNLVQEHLKSGVFLRNQNRAPVASCTAQYAGTGKQVALNGSASEDPEGFNMKTYNWYADGKLTDPPDATGVVAVWTSATSGTHEFRLHIEDQGGLPDDATCSAVIP